jgi:hypothetical protein
MVEVVSYLVLVVLLLLLFVFLLFRNSDSQNRKEPLVRINDFLPTHYFEFEQVERRLAGLEEALQRIQSERRAVALGYLDALREEFIRVQRLLNHAAKFLPELTIAGEVERLWLGIRFRVEYRLTRLWIQLGFAPAAQLQGLTRHVRRFAEWTDQALAAIAREHGLSVLQSDLNQ